MRAISFAWIFMNEVIATYLLNPSASRSRLPIRGEYDFHRKWTFNILTYEFACVYLEWRVGLIVPQPCGEEVDIY